MGTRQSLSDAVFAAVASRRGVDPSALDEPIYPSVDPDALDHLFHGESGVVSFEYLGHRIVVDHEGNVSVDGSLEDSIR